MMNANEKAVLKQTQKNLNVVKIESVEWNMIIDDGKNDVEKMINLAEQLQCIKSVDLDSCPLKKFPETKESLCGKIILIIKEHSDNVSNCLKKFQTIVRTYEKQNQKLRTVFTKSSIDLTVATQRTATWPSMVDMMCWLTDILRLYREDLYKKQFAFSNLDYSDANSFEVVARMWTIDKEVVSFVDDVLSKTTFFVDDSEL